MKILMLCFFVLPYLGVDFLGDMIGNVSLALYRLLLGV